MGGDGPTGFTITPKAGWPASTAITVKIPGGTGGLTNASLKPFGADTTFTFTTGADGIATNPIVIDDPFSSLKNGPTDCNTYSGVEGELLFKDSVTGKRAYMNESTLINEAISVTDANGIPVKGFLVNSFGSDDPGRGLAIGRRGSAISSLQHNTTYTIAFKGTIASSTGMTFVPVNYTFTTVPNNSTRERPIPSFNESRGKTAFLPPPPAGGVVAKQVELEVSVYSGFSANVSQVDAASGGNTVYHIGNGLPAWVLPNVTSLMVTGCNVANNGTYLVKVIDNSGPGIKVTLANAGGVAQFPTGGQITTVPYVVKADDLTPGNTFNNVNLPLDTSNGGSSYRYKTSNSGNETGFVNAGDHTVRLTVDDGDPTHLIQLNETLYFFPNADILAPTLDPTNPPTGGLIPTFNWSWTTVAPASATALVIQVVEVVGTNETSLGSWIVPPNLLSFTLPANAALNSGGNYKWRMGYFHSTDGTLRDHGGEARVAEVSFSEP
jgi:hypothetical protein